MATDRASRSDATTGPTEPNRYAPIPGTLVIGLGHRARSGKDTAANVLTAAFPGLVQRFAFADALRAYARVEKGMTTKDGALLQRLGVEKRATDPDVWVRATYWAIVEAAPRVAVLTDVRFPNEAEMVRALGGVTCRVTRIGADGQLYQLRDGRDPQHVSEVALVAEHWWDYQLANHSGQIATFRADVLRWFDDVCESRGIVLPARGWTAALRESRIGDAVV